MGGGICYTEQKMDIAQVKDTMDYLYDEYKIPICLTFSNPMIDSIEECEDKECNQLAELCEKPYNQIMVSSELLEAHLRKHYPQYKINKSIIKTEYGDIFSALDRYNKLVLHRTMNYDFDFLSSIPPEKRHQIEFLCRSSCPSDCPYTAEHYRQAGIQQKNRQPFMGTELPPYCGSYNMLSSLSELKDPSTITRFELDTIYSQLGFSQFKLSGRRSIWAICTNIVDYMILPPYQKDVFRYLAGEFFLYE